MQILIYTGNNFVDQIQKLGTNYKRKELKTPITYQEIPTHTAVFTKPMQIYPSVKLAIGAIASGTQFDFYDNPKWVFELNDDKYDEQIIEMLIEAKLHKPYGFFKWLNFVKRYAAHFFVKDDRKIGAWFVGSHAICTEDADYCLLKYGAFKLEPDIVNYLNEWDSNMISAIEILQIAEVLESKGYGKLTKLY